MRDATAARGRGAQISPATGISPSDMLAAAKLGRRRGVVEKVIKESLALVTLPVKTRGQTQREVRICKSGTLCCIFRSHLKVNSIHSSDGLSLYQDCKIWTLLIGLDSA